MQVLNTKELNELAIPYSSIARLIRELLEACSSGEAVSMPKLSYSTRAGNLFQAMMAVSDTPAYATVKAVGLSPDNSKKGLPHIGSTVTLFNATTGLPVALLDGSWITAVRTAAITLLAAQYLAPPKSRRIGFIGAGVQARSHLAAFREQFPIDNVMVYSRTDHSARQFADEIDLPANNVCVMSDPTELLQNSDIVISTVPASKELIPFLDPNHLPESSFAGMVDCGRSWLLKDVPPSAWVVIDDREQDRHSDVPLITPDRVDQDLLESVLDGNSSSKESSRNLFIFRGMAVGDLAAAILGYEALATLRS